MTTTERITTIDLTDEEADRLLEIPEVADAVDSYKSIQLDYREALFENIHAAPVEDGLPNVSDVVDRFRGRLHEQKRQIRKVALRHLQP